MAHPNEDLVRSGYAAFATGDMATLDELFADDIAWHAPGRNQLSGDYVGKEAVFGDVGEDRRAHRRDVHDRDPRPPGERHARGRARPREGRA